MKKWFVLALIACVAVTARAGEGEGKKTAEKKGVEFDAAKAESRFKKMDKDNDGKLTGEEVPQEKGKGKSGKSE